jgi:hypothetical protein
MGGMNIMPGGLLLFHIFQLPTINNNNMEGTQLCKVRSRFYEFCLGKKETSTFAVIWQKPAQTILIQLTKNSGGIALQYGLVGFAKWLLHLNCISAAPYMTPQYFTFSFKRIKI